MSDITLQSQQMAQQSQQFNAQRSDAAQQDMVSGLRQDVHFTQELAMQQESASLRNQMAQQEIQLNQGKLQMMQAIDQTDMGRVQVETAREQLKSLQFENKQREQALTTGPEAKKMDQFVKFATGMPKEFFLASGLLPNFETGTFEQADQAAIEQAYKKSGTNEQRLQEQLDFRRMQAFKKDHYQEGLGWDTPENEHSYSSYVSGHLPDGVTTSSTQSVKSKEPPTERAKKLSESVAAQMYIKPSVAMLPAASEQDRKRIGNAVGSFMDTNSAKVVEKIRQSAALGRTVNVSDDQILERVTAAVTDVANPWHDMVISLLINTGTLTREDIGKLWPSAGDRGQ